MPNPLEEKAIPYDPVHLDNLYCYLADEAEKDKARYYSIYIDHLPVVEKALDLDEFYKFKERIHPMSRLLTVYIYSTSLKSPRHHRYFFKLSKDPDTETLPVASALNGVDLEDRINEKLAIERAHWKNEQLEKDIEQLKEKLREAEEYHGILENRNEQLTGLVESSNKKSELENLGGFVKEMAPYVQSYLASKQGDGQTTEPLSGSQPGEATFSRTDPGGSALSPEQEKLMPLLVEMGECFDPDQLNCIMAILSLLRHEPQNIAVVLDLLTNPKKPTQ